jgi:hypothetical protein
VVRLPNYGRVLFMTCVISLPRMVAFAAVIGAASLNAQTLPPVAANITSGGTTISSFTSSRQAMTPMTPKPPASSLPRVYSSSLPRAVITKYPWKMGINATVFWVGELPTQNNPTPNTKSSWDVNWTASFGGYDDPDPGARAPDYRPAAFVPKQNPFYFALPYNDCIDYRTTKAEAARMIPWFAQTFKQHGKSVCRDRWVAIRLNDRTCYAQWSDCGPFVTTDAPYVFGDSRPVNTENRGAGIDLSPAVRDYLGFDGMAKVDWRFVDLHEVPAGPWRMYGDNNPFVKEASKQKDVVAGRLEELRRQRDEWFKQNGAGSLQQRR